MSQPSPLYKKLFSPIDGISISLFRIVFGVFVAIQTFLIYTPDHIDTHFVAPKLFFPFPLFEWLHLPFLPDSLLYLLFLILGISGICIAAGLFFRASLAVFLLGFGYVFLLETSYYNNHYYLLLLCGFLLLWTGEGGFLSVDRAMFPQRRRMSYYWHLFILRAQFSIVYFFSGVAKMYPDWLEGRNLSWMFSQGYYVGRLSAIPGIKQAAQHDIFLQCLAYGAFLFDLLIPFFLWYRPTRTVALILAFLFHAFNQYAFGIGIFHMFMIFSLVLFIDSEDLRRPVRKIFGWHDDTSRAVDLPTNPRLGHRCIGIFLTLYLCIQIALPLRHYVLPGDPDWYKVGSDFSWHLVRSVYVISLDVMIVEPTRKVAFYHNPMKDLSDDQMEFHINPETVVPYAQFLKKYYEPKLGPKVEVHMNLLVGLNGRRLYRYIDPRKDLTKQTYHGFRFYEWILPHPDVQETYIKAASTTSSNSRNKD